MEDKEKVKNADSLVKNIREIFDYLSIEFEDDDTILDFAQISGDDLEDLFKRKLVADLVVAKKLNLLKKNTFLNIFGYKK